ncbi:MAG: nucleotidyltransferase family protein, partial [Mariprofundaceae bacterium]|nr:nucleotidyltransferase family protein [Mariprofundaceae bacterium]
MKISQQKQFRQFYCQMLQGEWEGVLPQDISFWYMLRSEGIFFCVWQKLSSTQRQQIPSEIMHGMDERMYEASALRMKHSLGHILRALNHADIPVICLRGQALAEALYEPSSMRVFTDFDLLYNEKDSLMLKQVLGTRLMYAPPEKFPSLFKKGDLVIDLHTEPLGIERMQSWAHLTPLRASDFFKHATNGILAGEKALHVKARVNLPYLCFHAMKHSFDRLIWLYDIALLAETIQDHEWDDILQAIHEYRLERPCFYALSYVQKHLNAPVPDDILNDICPDMGWVERRLFARHMKFEVIPYLAERLFARMQPDWKHRFNFWKETIYPTYEVRAQIAGGGCVKCSFIRT